MVLLENKSYDETWGAGSKAPYLAKTLAGKGTLLTHYYGIGHVSLDNYLALISGQAPNKNTGADCATYIHFQATGPLGRRWATSGPGMRLPGNAENASRSAQREGALVEGLHGRHG